VALVSQDWADELAATHRLVVEILPQMQFGNRVWVSLRYPELVENGGPDMGKPRSISKVVFDCDIQSSQ